MKEKNTIKILVATIIVIIIGGMLFLFVIGPVILQTKITNHTKMYFQALQEKDMQTASQYIDWPNANSSSSEWLEKMSELQDSIIIHSIDDVSYNNHDGCATIAYTLGAMVNDENVEFVHSVIPSPGCPSSLTFDGLVSPYGTRTTDSELVKDVRFFVSTDISR